MEKKYNFKEQQEIIKDQWEKEQTNSFDDGAGPLFSIDTPPPTVSGSLHIGHIFSYTQTDIIARYKRMSGHAIFYPFGFDDNGLPTERFVEKKCKVRAHTLTRSDFINLCLEQTAEVEQQFKDLWQRIGLSVDWQKWYATISPASRKISQESFIRLYKKDYIYLQYEPALYCTTCRTSVAQAELEDIQKTSSFNDIIFKTPEGEELVIGTTRPELLPSCIALFYHPEDHRYTSLKGEKAIVPLFGDEVPILPDVEVDPEKGTGLVMCCTFGDKTDIYWFKTHKLPYKQSIGSDGKFLDSIPFIGSLKVADARKKIIDLLKEKGLLKKQTETTRAVNVHERCQKEIEYIALSQWFLKILPHKEQLIKQAEKISWHPTYMKTRYINWVENLSWDWCLSRQRFYGIPFPVWHCANDHVLLASLDQLPIDPQETEYQGPCPECGSTEIEPDKDVMDTWNTSSLTPQICFELFDVEHRNPFEKNAVAEFMPMSMRPLAHDIIRTWAFYTIVKSWMHYDSIPWKNIVISGHVLSDDKEKLSKSKEQKRLAPETLLEQYSADAIRYWTASGRLGQDISFSENQLKIGSKLVVKLWNAFRFISEHIPDKIFTHPESLGIVNEWILSQSSICFNTYKSYLDKYEFSLALDGIEHFFWNDFCDNYLELIKHQLFNPEEYKKEEVAATQWTLMAVGMRILQLYAPYLPFVTETIYQELYKKHYQKDSLHLTQFDNKEYNFEASVYIMYLVNQIVSNVRKLKTDQKLSLKTPLDLLQVRIDQEKAELLKPLEHLIKGITQSHTLQFINEKAQQRITKVEDVISATVVINHQD